MILVKIKKKRKVERKAIVVKKEIVRGPDLAVLYHMPKSTISAILKNKKKKGSDKRDVAKGATVVYKDQRYSKWKSYCLFLYIRNS